MLINYSNHPSSQWSPAQRQAAAQYGTVADRAFPSVPPEMGEGKLRQLAEHEVKALLNTGATAVVCQGEFTLCFLVAQMLLAKGITVLAACSERLVHEELCANGTVCRVSEFVFYKFRRYTLL